MKQLKRALAILLAVVMIVAVFPASVLAADDEAETFPYDGQGQAIIAWKMLSTATGYRISIYQDTVSDATLIETQNFGRTETEWDATDIIKTYGPGMYVAKLEALRNGTVRKTIVSDLMVIQMDQADANLAVVIDDKAATVSWDPIEEATLGCKITVALTDKESGEEVATQDYEVAAGETSVDVTDFVVEYADNETALELSATLSVIGDLTIQEKELVGPNGQTKLYKVCYLNSEPSAPAVAEQLVGILPLGVITSTEVDAVPGDPGKLTVNYKLEGGAVDYTYVKQLKLVLSCSDGEDVTTKTFTVDEVAAEGTIDVSKLIGSPGDYDWTVTLYPKYIGNAETENEGEAPVNYTVYELPAPVLTVADDASTISWPAVVASDEVEIPTTFDDDARYKIEVSTDGNNWSEITGGAITKETDEEGNVTFVVDISDKINEGETKNFKVTLQNTKDNKTYDPRFEGESFATVEVYKTIQPTNVAFDVVTGAYANPPEEDDQVFLTWTEPSSSDGIDSFKITIYKAAEEAAVDEEGNPVVDDEGNPVMTTAETPTEFTVAAADVAYDAGTARIDVSEYIDAENVADYTATVQSIGKHGNEDYSHFDADSGITAKSAAVTSGAVATAKEAAKIEEQDGKLVLVVDLDDANDNFAKIESAWLSDFNNGKTSYMESIKGVIDATAKTATFDLSAYYYDEADTSGDIQRLPSGDWSGTVSVYSFNNALNADTEAVVKATYKPYQLVILGEELLDEEGNPTGEVTAPLVVDPVTGEVSWADAYAYDDDNVQIDESKANYYMVKLEYLKDGEWKGVKIVGGDDNAEWEKILDTEETRNVYNIADSEAEDGGMVPGRVYRVNVQAFSDKPIEYIESKPPEQVKLCKFPAVTAAITVDVDYPAGGLSWTSDYTYPSGTEYQIDAVDGETAYTDKDTESPYSLYELLGETVEGEFVPDYGTYATTVTVLGIVDGDINYVQSAVSNTVTAYRGVVPAEDIEDDSIVFAFEAGGKLTLSYVLPKADDYTDEYDKAMANAIDPANITIKIFSDTGTLLGEYTDDDADGKVDVTIANGIASQPNLTSQIKAGEKPFVAICVGSLTEYVDGYSDFEVLEGEQSPATLAGYLSTDVADDAVKVATVAVPERDPLAVTARIATANEYDDAEALVAAAGSVVIDDSEIQSDAQPTYKVDIAIAGTDGSTTTTTYNNVDPETALATASIITAGTEATVTVTVTDATGKYADQIIEMKAYKLVDPTITEITNNTGKLVYTADATADSAGYAYTNDVTFATATEPEYTGASFDDPKITFDLTVEPQDVTVTLALVGGYDEPNEIYVIDADNTAETVKAAGLSPILSDPTLTIDPETGHQILKLKIDDTHPYYAIDWDNTPTDWKNVKIVAKAAAEVTFSLTHGTNVKNKDGYVVIDLTDVGTTLAADTEYTISVKGDAVRNHVKAVVGPRPDYDVGTVSYTANALEILTLEVTDFTDGTAEWTVNEPEKVDYYEVTVKRNDGEAGWLAVTDPSVKTNELVFDLDGGYTAGKEYTLTVQAMSKDLGYAPSPEKTIEIYKLVDPTAAAINTETGELTFTADEQAIENKIELSPDTATIDDSNIITFDLTTDAQTVTATITSLGGETDSGKFILDAANSTTADTLAGLAPAIEFVDKTFHKNADGKQYTEIKADAADDLYDALDWANFVVKAKNTETNNEYDGTIDAAAVTADGIATVVFSDLAPGTYTVTVTPAIATAYTAVAAAEEVTETCTYQINKIMIDDLAVVDNETGEATWTATPDTAVADYTVTVYTDGGSGWTLFKEKTVDTASFTLEDGYTAGTLYKVEVVANSSDPDYGQSDPAEIQIYRLTDPTITEIVKNGKVKFTKDETYASTNEFSADNNATVDNDTAIVTFDLTIEATDVTVTLETKGGYDSDAKVYVLDAENAATGSRVAGLMPAFSNATLTIDPVTGNQILTLDIDTNNKLYSETYSETPEMWNQIKITADGATDVVFSITHGANVRPNPGQIVIDLGDTHLGEGTYDILIDDAVRSAWAKVAGVRDQYSAGTVTVGAIGQLVVSDIKIVNTETGKATWTISDEGSVLNYTVTVSKASSDPSGWTTYYSDDTITEAAFDLTAAGYEYEAGTEYKLTVQAFSNTAAVDDSAEEYTTIYRLKDPTDVSISKASGAVSYTVDSTYASKDEVTVDGADYDADAKKITCDLEIEPVKVTATVASKAPEGGKDGDVWILDAAGTASDFVWAGLAPEMTLDSITYDAEKGQPVIIIKIDQNNELYGKNFDASPNKWQKMKVALKLNDEILTTFSMTYANNVTLYNTGEIRIWVDPSVITMTPGNEYSVSVTDSIKPSYAAVAGPRNGDVGSAKYEIAIEDILAAAKAYTYSDYVYKIEPTVGGTTITYAGAYADGMAPYSGQPAAVIADLARFLGAIYRGNPEGFVTKITYNNTEYTWDEATLGLKGSNWTDGTDTLVSKITAELASVLATNPVETSFTFQVNGEEVTVNIQLS